MAGSRRKSPASVTPVTTIEIDRKPRGLLFGDPAVPDQPRADEWNERGPPTGPSFEGEDLLDHARRLRPGRRSHQVFERGLGSRHRQPANRLGRRFGVVSDVTAGLAPRLAVVTGRLLRASAVGHRTIVARLSGRLRHRALDDRRDQDVVNRPRRSMVTVRVALSGFVSVMVIGVVVPEGMRPRGSKSNVLPPVCVCVTEYCTETAPSRRSCHSDSRRRCRLRTSRPYASCRC